MTGLLTELGDRLQRMGIAQLKQPAPSDADLAAVASAFGLGPVTGVEFIAEGLMNHNWRVTTADGVFALKLLRDVPAAMVSRNLEVLAELASAGIPVPTPRRTNDGGFLLATDSGAFVLGEWSTGQHLRGGELTLVQVRELGELIGHLHVVLNDEKMGAKLKPADRAPRAKVTTVDAAVAGAEKYLAHIAARPVKDDFDASAVADLRHRIALVAAHAGSGPVTDVPAGPFGWTHGDLQYRNLLWSGGEVSAILDWDRLGVRPFAEELVRTAQVQFTRPDGALDLDRIAVFSTAYRSVVGLSEEAVTDAVTRLWWKRLTDFWPLQWHYDRDDHGPDEIWSTGERQLRWWSRRLAPVTGAFLGGTA